MVNKGSLLARWQGTYLGSADTRKGHVAIKIVMGQLVSTWQVEMGWPDIHWLARDLGWAGGSHCVSFGQELEYAVGA